MTPSVIPAVVGMLVVFAFVAIAGVLIRPSDAVVIEVVPIDDDQVQVQVAGAVSNPGVYSLPPTATVADALQAAGGAVDGANTGSLDLAAGVTDGQFILVPADNSSEAAASDPINLNAASAGELEALPGVGPVIAARIVQHRDALGGFSSVDQLVDVDGISARMVAEMRPLVVVASQ